MTNNLTVSSGGLRAGATSSDAAAAALTINAADGRSVNYASQAGVAALDDATTSVRGRQANRIAFDARHMSSASSRYDDTDGSSAGNLAESV
jgi:hypothetical protein